VSTDDLDIEIARILANCLSDADLQQRFIKHARILQRLVCCMASRHDHAENRVRRLYADFADMAVEHIDDSRAFPRGKLH
jgi:hypothetical protein